ncbi:MAG: hypothetical protein ACO3EE_03540 [Flavobacteriales bacterium]
MKAKFHIIIATALYAFHLICKFNNIPVPIWLSSYFADFLCMPLLLSYTLILIRKIKKLPEFILSWQMILFATVYVSAVFEVVLPYFSEKYKGDWVDVGMYVSGAILFHFFQMKYLVTIQ